MYYTCEECLERMVCSKCHKQICHRSEYVEGCIVDSHYKMSSKVLTKRIAPLVCANCKVDEAERKK